MPAIRLQPGAGNHIATLVVLEARESMDSQPSPITSVLSLLSSNKLPFLLCTTPHTFRNKDNRILFDREIVISLERFQLNTLNSFVWLHGVMINSLDFKSSDPNLKLGGTFNSQCPQIKIQLWFSKILQD
ncbi:hypothetical protein CDAR_513441 [Caerostris darwini]|uniref:Uncharacterized protein n=1 Tax=Caerostris darwini TaxID=1538125 RepID=A0AAV4WTT1_9ARAC|nr:hypothetical protein CDAR_513441 [Caerostris darwini]